MVHLGEKFGNYQISGDGAGGIAILGSGAGGTTVRADHIHLSTPAAIKFLRRRGSHAAAAEAAAFLVEARAAAGLSHPHIARIYDFGEDASRFYYVMEFCEGGSLSQYFLRVGPLPSATALQWLREAASALGYAHEKGILHRDIKPSNLLLGNDREFATLKLIDFGLASQTGDAQASDDRVIGTPHYASPEQLRGDACAASDVFSLGASFLYLLTGRLLSDGSAQAVIGERLAATGYGHLIEDQEEPWRALLASMLEVDPGKRLEDGKRVEEAIARYFPDTPSTQVPWTEVVDAAAVMAVASSPWDFWTGVEGSWQEFWRPLEAFSPSGAGYRTKACAEDPNDVWELTLFEAPGEELSALLVSQGARIQTRAHELGLGSVALQRGDGWLAIAWPLTGGVDAISWIRNHPEPSLEGVLQMLGPLAAGLDGIAADGIEQLELQPAMLKIREDSEFEGRWIISPDFDLPIVAAGSAVESAATMTGSLGSLVARFAGCLYHFLGGRPVPRAAFMSSRAYPAIPRLTERANRFLSQAIAGQEEGLSCSRLLERVASEERLPSSSLHSGATFHPGSSASQRSPGSSQTFTQRRPSAPHATISGGPAASASASASYTTPAPVVAPASAPSLQPAPERPSAPIESPRKSKALPAIVGVCVLAAAIGAGYHFFGGSSKKDEGAGSEVKKDGIAAEVKEDLKPPGTGKATPMAGKKLTKVSVPGDASSLSAALELCADDGVVEIAGGTYREELLITRPVSIHATGGAALEDEGSHPGLLTVKGKIKATIQGLIFRNLQGEGKGAPEDSKPLVSAAIGAEIYLVNCLLDSSQGDGLDLNDKATASLVACRLTRNRGYGLHIAGGSSATVSSGSIEENGEGGVWISNPESKFRASEAAAIKGNSKNGVQATEGAAIQLSGAEVSGNEGAGVLGVNPGTVIGINGATTIADNNTHGLYLARGASCTVDGARFNRNKVHGLYAEQQFTRLSVTNSNFTSNARVGIFISKSGAGDSTITLCHFSGQAEYGVAIAEGQAMVSDCDFENNGTAVGADDASKGKVWKNRMSPGTGALDIDPQSAIEIRENIMR